MSINTFDNKKLLWATLQENNCFNGLPDNTFSPVKQQFEDFVIQNDNSNSSLVEKNKKVIGSMVKYLNNVKLQANTQANTLANTPANTQANTHVTPAPIEEIHKREDLQEQRQNMFQDRLKKRQEEFTSLIEKNRPKDIDFSDKNKESYSNIQQESERFIKQREKDLKTFPDQSKSTIQKLNIDNSIVGNRTAKEATENIVININSEKNKKIKQSKKQVSFQDGKHMIDEGIDSNHLIPEKKEKFNRLKSPPPPIAITDSSDEDHGKNNQLSEIFNFMSSIEKKLDHLEKKYHLLNNQITEIKTRMDNKDVETVCNDLLQKVESTTSIYDLES